MTDKSRQSRPIAAGDLVVVPAEPRLGVLRIESVDADRARLLSYTDGRFLVRPTDAVAHCPDDTPARSA